MGSYFHSKSWKSLCIGSVGVFTFWVSLTQACDLVSKSPYSEFVLDTFIMPPPPTAPGDCYILDLSLLRETENLELSFLFLVNLGPTPIPWGATKILYPTIKSFLNYCLGLPTISCGEYRCVMGICSSIFWFWIIWESIDYCLLKFLRTYLSINYSLTRGLAARDILGAGVLGYGLEQLCDTCMRPQFTFKSRDLCPLFLLTALSDSIICFLSSLS